jgi:ElaB/YqjD/DUF883 family membrane-anchored ribosome-binding protein
MDQTRAREIAKEAGAQAGKTINDAEQRAEAAVRPALDQGKAGVQDLANRASAAGTQTAGQVSEFIEEVAPQARQVAGNLYDQGARAGENVRQYAAQQPLTAMLIAGGIGFALGYLIHRR